MMDNPESSVPHTEVDRRVDHFTDALRQSGFKLTHQRLEVVREIASTSAHPDAEQLFKRVRERVPTISLDTVYRTLGTLADLGLVSRVAGVGGATRYDANTSRHHHFVCARCGRIQDIDRSDVDEPHVPALVAGIGDVTSVEVRFNGVCRSCEQRDLGEAEGR